VQNRYFWFKMDFWCKATVGHIRDPPPPPLDSRIALFQRCGKSNTGVYIRAFYFLVSYQPIGLCESDRDIQKIDHVAYETYPCGRCINTQRALAFGHITAHRAYGEVTGGLHGRSEKVQTELG
jgi:hypothetical protein